jgi:hypothetical protein
MSKYDGVIQQLDQRAILDLFGDGLTLQADSWAYAGYGNDSCHRVDLRPLTVAAWDDTSQNLASITSAAYDNKHWELPHDALAEYLTDPPRRLGLFVVGRELVRPAEPHKDVMRSIVRLTLSREPS